MFEIIKNLTFWNITDEACNFALCTINLGIQYVIKSNKALKRVVLTKEFYYCKDEIKYYKNYRNDLAKERQNSIKNFRSNHREGKYIDQIL